MDDKLLGVDVAQSAIALGVSISQIESVLGIVILIVQCCYILYRCIFNIWTSVKNKEYAKIGDSILLLEEDLIVLLEKLKQDSASTEDEEKKAEIEEKIVQVEKLIDNYGASKE